LKVRQAQTEGDVSSGSPTTNTASAAASFPNPCDNADFVAPVWEVAGAPNTAGEKATADITITDSANGYAVRCKWNPQSVSACEFIAANGDAGPAERKRQPDVAVASTKLLGHDFWIEAAGTDVKNPAGYNLMEEWLCGNIEGSFP
jgi:hypothetical protein